ncbi:hypothetical protein [Bosea sp. NPDC055594]
MSDSIIDLKHDCKLEYISSKFYNVYNNSQNVNVAKFILEQAVGMRPNIMITINSKRLSDWISTRDRDAESYEKLCKAAGIYLKYFFKVLLPEDVFMRSYEEWPPFMAFFENRTKFGRSCYGHYHILVSLDSYLAKIATGNDVLQKKWLSLINSTNEDDYSCVSIDDDYEKVCGYCAKHAGTDDSLIYSFDNWSLGRVTARRPRLKRVIMGKLNDKNEPSRTTDSRGVNLNAKIGEIFENKVYRIREIRRRRNNTVS